METETIEVELPKQYLELLNEIDDEVEDVDMDKKISEHTMNLISTTIEQNIEMM